MNDVRFNVLSICYLCQLAADNTGGGVARPHIMLDVQSRGEYGHHMACNLLLYSVVVAVVTARSTGGQEVTCAAAVYSPICACTPRRSYRTMTFHHECMLRKYLLKHPESEACKLHDGICSEEDKTCVLKVTPGRHPELGCQFQNTRHRNRTSSRRGEKKRQKLPIIIPRGSAPL